MKLSIRSLIALSKRVAQVMLFHLEDYSRPVIVILKYGEEYKKRPEGYQKGAKVKYQGSIFEAAFWSGTPIHSLSPLFLSSHIHSRSTSL
jgi:hypothetical protein